MRKLINHFINNWRKITQKDVIHYIIEVSSQVAKKVVIHYKNIWTIIYLNHDKKNVIHYTPKVLKSLHTKITFYYMPNLANLCVCGACDPWVNTIGASLIDAIFFFLSLLLDLGSCLSAVFFHSHVLELCPKIQQLLPFKVVKFLGSHFLNMVHQ